MTTSMILHNFLVAQTRVLSIKSLTILVTTEAYP